MGGRKLPYDAEIEYLESTGTQWIDTGKYPHEIGRWELTVRFTDLGLQINGCYPKTRERFHIGTNGSGRFRIMIGITSITQPGDLSIHTFCIDTLDWYAQFDDIIVTCPTVSYTSQTTYSIIIANRTYYGNSGSFTYPCKECIYKSRLYGLNRALVLDLIPVRIGTTGYMYDKVSGRLFGNAGTGEFILGPDV